MSSFASGELVFVQISDIDHDRPAFDWFAYFRLLDPYEAVVLPNTRFGHRVVECFPEVVHIEATTLGVEVDPHRHWAGVFLWSLSKDCELGAVGVGHAVLACDESSGPSEWDRHSIVIEGWWPRHNQASPLMCDVVEFADANRVLTFFAVAAHFIPFVAVFAAVVSVSQSTNGLGFVSATMAKDLLSQSTNGLGFVSATIIIISRFLSVLLKTDIARWGGASGGRLLGDECSCFGSNNLETNGFCDD